VRPRSIYGFTYPPFAVLVMSPLSLVGFHVAGLLHTAVNVVLVAAGTWWLSAPIARRLRWPTWFAAGLALPVVLLMEPIRETLGFGQINVFLGALIAVDLLALLRGRAWAGVGIGLATAIKLTPGVLVLYLLLTGRRRATGVAVGTALGATALAFAVAPGTSREFWTSVLWDTGRVGREDKTSNQSLLGALARFAHPGQPSHLLWVLLALGTLVVGLGRARAAVRAGDELVGITLAGLVSCLISPISWSHHLYWLVPAVAVLVDVAVGAPLARGVAARARAARWSAGAAAAVITVLLCAGFVWFFTPDRGQHHTAGLINHVGESAYVWIMLALLVLLPIRAHDAAAPVVPRADRALAAD